MEEMPLSRRVTPNPLSKAGETARNVLISFTLSLYKDMHSMIPLRLAELPWAILTETSWVCAYQCGTLCEYIAHCLLVHPCMAYSPGSLLRCLPHMSPLCSFSERENIAQLNLPAHGAYQVFKAHEHWGWFLELFLSSTLAVRFPNLENIKERFGDSSGQYRNRDLIY